MKLSNMSDSFLSNIHLSLYWSWAFLNRDSHSNVAFACIKRISGDVRSSLIGCWDRLQAATDRVQRGGLQGWRVTGLEGYRVGSYLVLNNGYGELRGVLRGGYGVGSCLVSGGGYGMSQGLD